ncbi:MULTISPECIES: hypothetical protein [unclassified Psychrobacter]|uniref:hypothetical protein n=1 Tax=unclassified Psychrobacter TaxID=196806 RepID=UPI0025F32F0E|nr:MULTISPECIES: hypothetical protein [unclassified Psychrobacter]
MTTKSVNQLSDEQSAWSRNMQSQIMQSVAVNKQSNVADCIGVDTTTVGRWLDAKNPDSKIVQFCDMLAFCGLKVVPADMKCYDAAKIDILFRLAKDNFQRLEEVDDFFHDDAKTQIAEGTYRPRGVL